MPIDIDPGVSETASTFWHDWLPVLFVVGMNILAAAHLAARKAKQMTDEQKLVLLRRAPSVAAFLDTLIAFKVDSQLLNDGLRRIAQGRRAPSVIAMLDAADKGLEPDPELSRAMKSLPPMPLLSLPPPSSDAPVGNHPALPLASRSDVRERYGVIGSRDARAPEEPKETTIR